MAYGSAIPYSILLGTFIICGFQGLQQADKTKQVKFGIGTLAFCFGLGLILLQYRFSPLLVTYNGWDKSADYNYDILSQIAEHIDELPDPGLITVRNASFRHFTGKNPTLVRSATYLKAYSIKSYLHFIKPGNHIVVVMRDPHSYKTVPDYIELSFEQLGPNHTDIRINYPLYEPEPGNRKKIKRTKRTPERETVQREQLRRELTK
jgi:hypothetical protein